MQPNNLSARLEGGLEVTKIEEAGITISFRHPTKEQISAAMAGADVNFNLLQGEASEGGHLTPEQMGVAGKMLRAYELVGAYCISRVEPAPLAEGMRVRDEYGLIRLSEEALLALDPYVRRLGEYLFEQSKVGDEEGEG